VAIAGTTSMLEQQSCWDNIMLTWQHVETAACWDSNMLEQQHVGATT